MRRSAALLSACLGACAAGDGPGAPAGGAAGEPRSIVFERITLSTEFTSEGATFGDLDRDGANDVVAGPYWYAGPGFETARELYPPRSFDPRKYSDHFFDWLRDRFDPKHKER